MDFILALAGIGVLIGLLYLGAQIQGNTRAVRASTAQALVTQSTQLLESIYTNADISELLARARSGVRWEELTPIQQARAHTALIAAFRTFDNMLFQRHEGTLDDAVWPGFKAVIIQYSELPLWLEWFGRNRELFSEELGRLITTGRLEDLR